MMDALDLLFNVKPESERMHQAALTVLFERTPLLRALTGEAGAVTAVTWEPDGGAFDLMVETADRRTLLELKVDSVLSRWQVQQQLTHPLVGGGAAPVYVLIGTSAIARGARWNGWAWLLGDRPRPALIEGDALVAAVRAAVVGAPAELRELGEAYARLVEGLTLRTRRFAGKTILEFGYHDYFGYFDALRHAVDPGVGATVEYVPNAAGGFVACAWEGIPTRVGGVYLQLEERSSCVKLWVDDMAKELRSAARRAAVDAAIAAAGRFPGLGVEATKGKPGETMTLVRLTQLRLTPDPRDPALLASLREAQAFVRATAERLGPAK